MSARPVLRVRQLGCEDYQAVWQRMTAFTDARDADTVDEMWLVQHPPVFTLGQAGRREHLLNPGDIPVINCDRGGQVTYHGPGQLVAYPLLDLRRCKLGVRALVDRLEECLIRTLASYDIAAERRDGAPGVYVGEAKIASLGLRIRRSCSFHGISLNVDMDLEPFARINPCGYAGLRLTQMRELAAPGSDLRLDAVAARWVAEFCELLGYSAQWPSARAMASTAANQLSSNESQVTSR